MAKLTRIDIQKLEHYWINHFENKKRLKYREWELLHPYNEESISINVKSSKISNPTQRDAFRLEEDELYRNLSKIVNAIDLIYKELDKDLKTIVDMRYWDNDNNCYEWEEIADELFMSRNKVLRKRNVLLELTAKRIGFV